MTIPLRQLSPQFAVSPQLLPTDLATAKALGYQTIINNRPDGEEPHQPSHQALQAEAERLGLAYCYIPVAGIILPPQVEALRQALVNLPQPILAFCRSGTRSSHLWAQAVAQK